MIVNMTLECHVFILWIFIWILSYQEQECCRFGPGPNCGFPCRCTGANVCDPDTGDCIDGSHCQSVLPDGYGWTGPGCRIGNVAYAKTNVDQYGQYSYYSPDLAVDGDTTPYISNDIDESCAHPLSYSGSYASWWVDLEDIFTIQSVTIVNRLKPPGTGQPQALFQERSTDYDIKIGNTSNLSEQTLCFQQDKLGDDIQPIETMTCNNGDMVGRYVSFTRTGGRDPNEAAICEFIVMGYNTIVCHQTDCTGACDSITGCDQCAEGKMLPDCKQECPNGYWGVNCSNACGKCKDGAVCDKVTGSCGEQCKGWYMPQLCNDELRLPPGIYNVASSDIASDTATISWDRSSGVDSTIRQYFYYTVQYRRKDVNTDNWFTSERIPLPNEQLLRYELLDLAYNTKYEIQIVSHREMNGLTEAGIIKTAEFTTLCIDPDTPPTPSIHGTPDRFTVTWDDLKRVSPRCDRLESAAIIITCENSTHIILNETFNILIATNAFTYDTTHAILCSVVLSVTNNAGFSSTSVRTSLTTTTTTTLTDSPTTQVATQAPVAKQQITDGGPDITAVVAGGVACLVVIFLVVLIVVLALRKRRNMSSANDATRVTGTAGYGKPNPVYENTKNNENDMDTNINPPAVYESIDGITKTDNTVTTPETSNVVYENTKGPESQYASLVDAHRNTPEPSSVYQELK